MFSERIIRLGKKFRNRLDKLWLESALDYTNYNEESLAFDLLCGYLADYNISLCQQEYEEIIRLAMDMGFDLNGVNFKYLEKLVRNIDK